MRCTKLYHKSVKKYDNDKMASSGSSHFAPPFPFVVHGRSRRRRLLRRIKGKGAIQPRVAEYASTKKMQYFS
jgi:hypothetical protein